MIKKIIRVVITLLLLSSCDYIDSRLYVNNQSNRTIFFQWKSEPKLDSIAVITRYSSVGTKEDIVENISDKVSPFSKNNLRIWTYRGWNKYFNKHDTLYLFLFDKDTLEKYSWDKIRQSNNFVKKYSLTLDDIKKYNWEVVYKEH
jgi:hypothetical protein